MGDGCRRSGNSDGGGPRNVFHEALERIAASHDVFVAAQQSGGFCSGLVAGLGKRLLAVGRGCEACVRIHAVRRAVDGLHLGLGFGGLTLLGRNHVHAHVKTSVGLGRGEQADLVLLGHLRHVGARLFGVEASLNQEIEAPVSLNGTEPDQSCNNHQGENTDHQRPRCQRRCVGWRGLDVHGEGVGG